jgi:hypothetical protein
MFQLRMIVGNGEAQVSEFAAFEGIADPAKSYP